MMGNSEQFAATVNETTTDSAELHAQALERLARDIRRGALVGGHMRVSAETTEGEPIIKDGQAWENLRPTGRVLHQIELILDRNAIREPEKAE